MFKKINDFLIEKDWIDNFKEYKIPLLKKFSYLKQIQILSSFIMLFLVSGMILVLTYSNMLATQSEKEKIILDVYGKVNAIGKNTNLAIHGDSLAFNELKTDQQDVQEAVSVLKNGGAYKNGINLRGEDSKSGSVIVERLDQSWKEQWLDLNKIINSKTALVGFSDNLKKFNGSEQEILERMRLLKLILNSLGKSEEEKIIEDSIVKWQRITKNSNKLENEMDPDFKSIFFLSKDITSIWSNLKLLSIGDDDVGLLPLSGKGKEHLDSLIASFKENSKYISLIQMRQADWLLSKKSYLSFYKNNEEAMNASLDLKTFYHQKEGLTVLFYAIGFVALSLMFFLVLFIKVSLNLKDDFIAYKQTILRNEKQQKDMNKLLEEIQEIGEGDLTIKATVNDSVTGAIADSLNFMVGELRRVIMNVYKTSKRVNETSESATQIASQLSILAQEQFKKLAITHDEIMKMSLSMNDITQDTTSAATASKKSLDISEEGKKIVEESVERMNAIREKIQDTSKRIKMLGESSTAIGEVTGLIRDITKQIDVLALNASIEAASAGDAGRGFAVVAAEVQRLAFSSAEAAKKIDDLILTIQEDAKGAVSAMEESTKEVVEGARLTDKAGMVLSEIGDSVSLVSREIEMVTSKIQVESKNATNLSNGMKYLQEYNEKTVMDTKQASKAIEEVNKMTDELKDSVANFKF